MHRRLGSATLSQLAFPGENNPNFPWDISQWDNTVVKKKKRKRKKRRKKGGHSPGIQHRFWSENRRNTGLSSSFFSRFFAWTRHLWHAPEFVNLLPFVPTLPSFLSTISNDSKRYSSVEDRKKKLENENVSCGRGKMLSFLDVGRPNFKVCLTPSPPFGQDIWLCVLTSKLSVVPAF